MIKWLKERTVTIQQAAKMREEELQKSIIVGEFVQRRRSTLVENIYAAIKEAQMNSDKN